MLTMTNMTDVVNNVASALRETRPAYVDPDLYLAVLEMPGFTTEALIVASPTCWKTRPLVGAL